MGAWPATRRRVATRPNGTLSKWTHGRKTHLACQILGNLLIVYAMLLLLLLLLISRYNLYGWRDRQIGFSLSYLIVGQRAISARTNLYYHRRRSRLLPLYYIIPHITLSRARIWRLVRVVVCCWLVLSVWLWLPLKISYKIPFSGCRSGSTNRSEWAN